MKGRSGLTSPFGVFCLNAHSADLAIDTRSESSLPIVTGFCGVTGFVQSANAPNARQKLWAE